MNREGWRLKVEEAANKLSEIGWAPESTPLLNVIMLKQIILTSEDVPALVHAAANLCTLSDESNIQSLLSDAAFHDRLLALFELSSQS